MRNIVVIRFGALVLGLTGGCLMIGGCGGQQTETGPVVTTTEDEYKQMQLENQSNEALQSEPAKRKTR